MVAVMPFMQDFHTHTWLYVCAGRHDDGDRSRLRAAGGFIICESIATEAHCLIKCLPSNDLVQHMKLDMCNMQTGRSQALTDVFQDSPGDSQASLSRQLEKIRRAEQV